MKKIALYLKDIPAVLGGQLTQEQLGLSHEQFTNSILDPYARVLAEQGASELMWALIEEENNSEKIVSLQPVVSDIPPLFNCDNEIFNLEVSDKDFKLAQEQIKRIIRCSTLWIKMADEEDVTTTPTPTPAIKKEIFTPAVTEDEQVLDQAVA